MSFFQGFKLYCEHCLDEATLIVDIDWGVHEIDGIAVEAECVNNECRKSNGKYYASKERKEVY